MESLTLDEKYAIEELRKRVQNDITKEMRKDNTLYYRFLKARDFKVNLAESMLRKHIAWRIANQVDTILMDYRPPEVLTKHLSYNFLGFNKDGYPVVYHTAGKVDIDGVLKAVTFSELKRIQIYLMEEDLMRLKAQNEKTKKTVMQFCYIYNLEFLTLAEGTKKKNFDFLSFILKMAQDQYPERMKTTYVINAPPFFTMIYSVLKTFMSDAMLQKLQVFGTEGWKEIFSNSFDATDLPVFLGGLKTDPDGNPYCHTFLAHGSAIPVQYYMRNIQKPLSQEQNTNRLLLSERSKSEVPLDVHQENSIIKWKYESRNGDIGFGLFYQENRDAKSQIVQLIPVEKMQSSEGHETGMFRCNKAGTYILVFDNSHSWLHSKEVYYIVNIVKSKKEIVSTAG